MLIMFRLIHVKLKFSRYVTAINLHKKRKNKHKKNEYSMQKWFFFWKKEKQNMQWVEEQENAANKS